MTTILNFLAERATIALAVAGLILLFFGWNSKMKGDDY